MEWLLVLYTVAANPTTSITVDHIASQESCVELGEQLVADAKRANSSIRTVARCYSVNRSQQSPQ